MAEALATENVTFTVTITSRRFDVEPRRWEPAAAGTAVTVASTHTGAGNCRRA
ncbi:hypothetical protein P9209_15995 [Prescottella defluvii]|nr:hypothetical protein P9209_15995 [Prescottella defluvii]